MGSQAAITDVLLAGAAMVLTLVAGVVAHEGSHALVLRALGVPVDVEWLPDAEGRHATLPRVLGRWAQVTPRTLPADTSPGGLRLAAVAPLALATPMVLVLLGVLPDPTRAGSPPLVAATLAWFGCALPSPRDFSLFWYAEAAIEEHADSQPADSP